jgi:chloride channel 7
VEREFQIHRTEEDYALAEFWRWALAFLIGVAMGCIGFGVDLGIESLNNFKYLHTVNTIAARGVCTAALLEPAALALLDCPSCAAPPAHASSCKLLDAL